MRAAVLALGVLTVALLAGASAEAAHPGRNGVIALISERGGQEGALYTIAADGSRLRRLSRPPALPASEVAFSRDGRLMAFGRPRGVTDELWLARPDGSAPRLLVRTGEVESFAPTFSPDGRTVAFTVYERKTKSFDLWRIGVDGRGRRPLIAARGNQGSPDWSPDGRRLAYGGDRGVYVFDLRTGKSRLIGPGGAPSWSPDGRRIVSASRFGIYVFSSSGGPPRKFAAQERGLRLDSPAWSPDGRRIALAGCCENLGEGEDGGLRAVVETMRPDGRNLQRTLLGEGDEAISPAWTRAGRLVVSDGYSLLTIGLLGQKPGRFFPPGGGYAGSPAWSPDGRRLALETDEGTSIANAGGQGGTLLGEGYNPSWSADGERIAFEDGGGIEVVTIATRERERILPDEGAGDDSKGQPAWSPDGATIAYAAEEADGSGRLAFYDVATRRSRVTAFELFGDIDWRPDGGAVVYATARDCGASLCTAVRVYDVRSRRSRLLIPNGLSPAWSPDGGWIAFVSPVRGSSKIFIARADGTGVRQLTRGAGNDGAPAWQPLPR